MAELFDFNRKTRAFEANGRSVTLTAISARLFVQLNRKQGKRVTPSVLATMMGTNTASNIGQYFHRLRHSLEVVNAGGWLSKTTEGYCFSPGATMKDEAGDLPKEPIDAALSSLQGMSTASTILELVKLRYPVQDIASVCRVAPDVITRTVNKLRQQQEEAEVCTGGRRIGATRWYG